MKKRVRIEDLQIVFTNGKELLEYCEKEGCSISEAMRQRELADTPITEEEMQERLDRIYQIMQNATHAPLVNPGRSMGGLIGGEGKAMMHYANNGESMCSMLTMKAVAYSLACLETNATMGLIVAAPTAGSSGVLPGVLLACMEEKNLSRDLFDRGILNAGAIGFLFMRNASVSGAEAGCQAEVGSASAMAASALVEILGGTPKQCLDAAALATSNLLGLVCDPIAGLVEAPCQSRNSIGVTNAIISADLVLSGVESLIPFDEMVECMYRVGKSIPYALRETAMGGCAATPTGCAFRQQTIIGETPGGRLEPLVKS